MIQILIFTMSKMGPLLAYVHEHAVGETAKHNLKELGSIFTKQL
jgi:hypothetical protein